VGKLYKTLRKAGSATGNDYNQPQLTAAGFSPVSSASAGAGSPFFRQDINPLKWNERLLAAMGTASEVAEAFRRLRTFILHPPSGKEPARTIMVTSSAPGEGKTFVCSGLAVVLAQGVEEHALVIDCDLRRPSLAAMFGLAGQKGLADYLRSGLDLGQLIRTTGIPKLSVIASGAPPDNPAELLGSERLPAMINEVASRYPDRHILFDSPPLGGAAETAVLAKYVDGVVLVVREGKSRREEVRYLVETIGPEKIIAVVFNGYQTTLLERSVSGSYSCYYSYHVTAAS
jgi:protein-tyrosine kinase